MSNQNDFIALELNRSQKKKLKTHWKQNRIQAYDSVIQRYFCVVFINFRLDNKKIRRFYQFIFSKQFKNE